MLLTAKGISKRFGANPVLQDASFSVRDQEILGLIGPNGAGKTTLFECLAGLLPVNAGAVRHVGAGTGTGERKRVLYYVPDGIHPWPDQTLGWATHFYERLFARSRAEAERVLHSLGLVHLAESPLGWLSKGESKRAMIALGLLTPQPILMLDEPFDGLDLRQMRDVMALFKEVSRAGRTLMLSVHELAHAAQICDRLVLLSAGRVAGEGTLDELRARAGLAAGGIAGGIEEVFLALTAAS